MRHGLNYTHALPPTSSIFAYEIWRALRTNCVHLMPSIVAFRPPASSWLSVPLATRNGEKLFGAQFENKGEYDVQKPVKTLRMG